MTVTGDPKAIFVFYNIFAAYMLEKPMSKKMGLILYAF